jgi:predicted ATP-dependent protease
MYILSGFLNAVLARERTLGFSASVCFEQSYGVVDGDSATIAELTAIISSAAQIPVNQNVAMTGSLNQFGDVQPVGGINEKAEGFYKTCKMLGKKSKGYTLVIPHQNVSNLMLNSDVRKAVQAGYMKIIPVKYFWEAFEIATGLSLGITGVDDAKFAPNSAFDIITKKLARLHADDKDGHGKDAHHHQNHPKPGMEIAARSLQPRKVSKIK